MAVDDIYTKALLHFEGADASTTFTDESGLVWTPVGTAQIDTAAYKFQTACMLLDGDSDSIYADFEGCDTLGSKDFTIDFWIKTTQTTQYATYVSKSPNAWSSGNWSLLGNYNTAGDIGFYAYDYAGGATLIQTAGGYINTGNWVHVAVVRYGNTWNLYIDGTSRASATQSFTIAAKNGRIYIGQDQAYSRWFNGQIDEFRYSKGIARWTGAFTPPVSHYRPRMNYLHARRDRMNMKGVSTQNSLA